jgi:hypothetical protein
MDEGGGFERLRSVVVTHGHPFEIGPVDDATLRQVAGELALPTEFASLYAVHGPVPSSNIPWVVEDAFVFAYDELVSAQAGYRWIGDGPTRSPEWPEAWVVVAAASGDPFLVDVTKEGCPVSFARHGAGSWTPIEVASSMVTFLEALARFEEILLGDFDLDVFDDDGLLPQFVQAVERELGGVLSSDQAARFAELLA